MGRLGYRNCPCLGVSGTLVAEQDAKLHIEEKYCYCFGYGRNRSELECLTCTVENGKMQDVQNYFTSSVWQSRQLSSISLLLGVLILINIAILSIPQYDATTFILKFLFQGLFLFVDRECIRAIHILREYPVKPERTNQ